ncbi:MAG: hypothetical protein ABIJ03_02910 [Patescibacteria group bacterium]|nr:hypothetical protein [Patescibacteria group bacterium]
MSPTVERALKFNQQIDLEKERKLYGMFTKLATMRSNLLADHSVNPKEAWALEQATRAFLRRLYPKWQQQQIDLYFNECYQSARAETALKRQDPKFFVKFSR